MIRNLPEMQVTWILSLDREDPLGKEMATHSSILAWRIPWAEEPGALQSTGSQRAGHSGATNISTFNGFRWTAKLLSHAYMCLHSPLNFPPIQAATLSRVPSILQCWCLSLVYILLKLNNIIFMVLNTYNIWDAAVEMRGRELAKLRYLVLPLFPPQPDQFIQSLWDGIQVSVFFSSLGTYVQPVLRSCVFSLLFHNWMCHEKTMAWFYCHRQWLTDRQLSL